MNLGLISKEFKQFFVCTICILLCTSEHNAPRDAISVLELFILVYLVHLTYDKRNIGKINKRRWL